MAFTMMKAILVIAAISSTLADDLPPSCKKPVYCDSSLLHHVQMARLYPDSKTFVDLQMYNDPNTTLSAFDVLLNDTNGEPSKDQLQEFVDQYFHNASELADWTPTDYTDEPTFLLEIRDESLREFAKNINAIWPTLGRKVKDEVFENPDQYSFVPVPNGFIIPGGRFTELYYWDTYWIIKGLLISGMQDTARGMLENFIAIVKMFGKVLNGSRWYYQERSQPPLLTPMMGLYYSATNDIAFLKANIQYLEKEAQFWLDTQIVTFDKDGRTHTLLRYYVPSAGPRPESYYEDYTNSLVFQEESRRTDFFIDIKSAAETGWDFSSRWFVSDSGDNSGNLTNIHTRYIIPVDLNSIFANVLQELSYFQAQLGNRRQSRHWGFLAKQWRSTIEQVLWDEADGVWYDYDMQNQIHRKYFYPSNVAPLWMGALDKDLAIKKSGRVLNYLRETHGLDFAGGVPTSLIQTGEQWDLPNAWPPLISIVVNALEAIDNKVSKELAFKVSQTWVRSNHKGFLASKQMFEKYDANTPGIIGGGGEYIPQAGFGWSNGVCLELLNKYGSTLTANDDSESGYASDSSQSSKSSSQSSSLSESEDLSELCKELGVIGLEKRSE